ncbi:MAG: hypothetical protein WCG23_01235 [bacterium]
MGLAASQGRLLMLTARKSDLEFQVQNVNQQRMIVSMAAAQVGTLYAAQMSAVNPTSQTYASELSVISANQTAALAVFQSQDKSLECVQKNLDTQHNEVQTEYDAVKKVIDKNIETSFKTLG